MASPAEWAMHQDCPACEGILPADAVTVTEWVLIRGKYKDYLRRKLKLFCPHCEHKAQRFEVQVQR